MSSGPKRVSVSAGAADLLVVGLDRLGQVGVGHPADIGLVDAHAEGDGRHDDQSVFGGEAVLDPAAVFRVHAAVVAERGVPVLAERLGQRLGLCAGAAVDDARLAATGGGEGEDLAAGAVLGLEGKVQVRTVEAAQEGARRFAVEEPGDDLVLRLGIGGGGEGGQRHVERAAQLSDPEIVGAEVVAPLADAVRLVNGDQADPGIGQHPLRATGGEPLGGEVKELQLARRQRVPDGVGLLGCIGRGQRPGGDPGLAQAANLVAHQRDQRRDHQRDPGPQQGGKLKAQRLAAARGHDGKNILARGDGVHDLFLAGAEGVESEYVAQKRGGVGHVAGHWGQKPADVR
jgi:hypothetical protein